jgi:hypothetical protein
MERRQFDPAAEAGGGVDSLEKLVQQGLKSFGASQSAP